MLSALFLPPSIKGSTNADVIFFPAFIADVVKLDNAVAAITCIDENLILTLSIALSNPDRSTFFAAELMFSNPVAASFIFNFSLSLSNVDILVATFSSKCLLSNRISTILLSISVLIY